MSTKPVSASLVNVAPQHRHRAKSVFWSCLFLAFAVVQSPAENSGQNPAQNAIQNLVIAHAATHSSEDGPLEANGYVPGQTVHVSFEIEGYHKTPDDQVKMHYSLQAFDPRGIALVEPIPAAIDVKLADEDKHWKPKVHQSFLLPPIALPGKYQIKLDLMDETTKQVATTEMFFDVDARKVELSDALAIRDFAYYRNPDDEKPLVTAAYRPGDTLAVRFNIVGYKYGAHNAVDVSYSTDIADASGKVLYSQPEPAQEQSSAFYPKPYVPGAFSLGIQPKTRPGEYAIVLHVKDNLSGQVSDLKKAFQIEQ